MRLTGNMFRLSRQAKRSFGEGHEYHSKLSQMKIMHRGHSLSQTNEGHVMVTSSLHLNVSVVNTLLCYVSFMHDLLLSKTVSP